MTSRRSFVKGLGTAAAIGAMSLAGCSGASGSSGEVVKNELEGDIEVKEMSLSNETVMGTKAVSANITLKNTTSEKISFTIRTTFYNSDETQMGEDEAFDRVGEYEIEGGIKKEVQELVNGRKDDVASYEVEILQLRS